MSWKKRLVTVLGVLAIGLLLNLFIPLALPSIPSVRATSRTIWLVGYASAWNQTNPTITVTQGDTITVYLSSGDGLRHNFFVDVNGDGLENCPPDAGCSAYFWTGNPTTVTFTVDFAPGTYKYVCLPHIFSQKGDFIVQPFPDFVLTSNPSSVTIAQGSSGMSTINVTAIGNFIGNVTLSASVSPTGPTTYLSSGLISLSSTVKSATSKLTISVPMGTTPELYTIVVTGSNGTMPHTATVQATVPTPSPSSSTGTLFTAALVSVVAVSLTAIAVATIYFYRRRLSS